MRTEERTKHAWIAGALAELASDLEVLRGKLAAGEEASELLECAGGLALSTCVLLEESVPEERKLKEIDALEDRLARRVRLQRSEPQLVERLRLEREIAVLRARLESWRARDALRFEDLTGLEGETLGVLLREAVRDIRAGESRERAIRGVELALQVALVAAGVAESLAAGVA